MSKKIALIDGYGFVFRSYHSLPPLTRSDKTPVGAVYGFTNMLIKLLASLDVSHVAIVFDAGSKTFRNDIYSEYKANRPPCPEDLLPQFPIIREAAESLNLAILEKAGFEADDIIATLSKQYEEKDYEVLIVSSDKDLMQLVSDKTKMYDAMKNKIIGPQEVKDKFDVNPDRVLDLLSLVGDASDNVPGVRGIGPKTAAELLAKYDNLENIFNHLDEIKQKKRKEYLENGQENAKLSKTLITLKYDVQIGLNEDDLRVKSIDGNKLLVFLQNQGFRSLVERVKKEFKVDHENLKDNKKEIKNNKAKKESKEPEFDEIKKIKIENESRFIEIYNKIKKNSVVIIHYEDSLDELSQVTLSTLNNDELLEEIYFLDLEKLSTISSNENEDLFSFEEKNSKEKLGKQDWQNQFYLQKIQELLKDDAIKKIFFDAKKFMKFFLNLNRGQNLRFESYEDISLMNHLLNSSIKNNFGELIDKNFNDNFESRNYEEIYHELKKSKQPAIFLEDEAKKCEFYCFCNYSLLKLYKILSSKIYENKLSTSYLTYERPLLFILAKMENEGIAIDSNKLGILSKEFEDKITKLSKEIYDISGAEFNIASTKQLAEILFNKLGLASSKKSKKTGAFSTKSSVLQEMVLDGHVIAEKILDFRHYSKLKNTYTDSLPKEINKNSNRIHTNFSTINTITGRLSSNNPNLQNIPIRSEEGRKIRKCFIAKDEHLLISADYSQIELRVIAHAAKIQSLINAFKEDKDIHAITAAQVFNVKENEVTKDLRSKAKAINFGIVYGISAFGLAKQLKISRIEALEYINNYLKTYPGIEGYMHYYKEFAQENGFVQTIGGRKCFIKEINSSNHIAKSEAQRQAINAPIQGSAADVIKKAMIKIDKKLEEINSSAKVILQIHDELIVEARQDEAEHVAKIIKSEMENAMILDCPLKANLEISKSWK